MHSEHMQQRVAQRVCVERDLVDPRSARYDRDKAEIRPRYSRDTAEIRPRYGRIMSTRGLSYSQISISLTTRSPTHAQLLTQQRRVHIRHQQTTAATCLDQRSITLCILHIFELGRRLLVADLVPYTWHAREDEWVGGNRGGCLTTAEPSQG